MRRFVFFLAAAAFASAAAADRLTITDLPPGIVRGYKPTIDLIIHSSPAADLILQVCYEFHAVCAISGVPASAVGFTCRGESTVCWRRFIHSLKLAGIAVRVGLSAGGASYTFWQTGGSLREGQSTAGQAGVRERPAARGSGAAASSGASRGGNSGGAGSSALQKQ